MKNYGDKTTWIDGEEVVINEIENPYMRASYSIGHFPSARSVVYVKDVEWPYSPAYCPVEDYEGKWFYSGTFLLCTGCGLDCT